MNRFARVVLDNHGKELVSAGQRAFEAFAKIAPKKRVAYWGALGVKGDRGEFIAEFENKLLLRWPHR